MKTTKTKPETKTEEKITFQTVLNETKKTAFILFQDSKKEIAIFKEKIVDVTSPKNVLHCIEGTETHADYIGTATELYSMEELYRTARVSKGTYKINPVIAGLIYHFCERIEQKITSLKDFKDTKTTTKDQAIKSLISCDLKNMRKFIGADLINFIDKDYPERSGNVLNEYLSCADPSTGIINFNCK